MIEIKNLPKIKKRDNFSHKGDYGRVFVIAGSLGMLGAACLTTKACLRSGAGLVTLGVPKSLITAASIKLTCAMTKPLSETKAGTLSIDAKDEILSFSNNVDVVAIGPGISQNLETIKLINEILPLFKQNVVIDADGLNALNGNTEVLKKMKQTPIVTPHPGEFSRLLGLPIKEINKDKVSYAINFAKEHSCIVVLKFAPTIITDGEKVFINNTGNPGMATGGSGDVLTGVISSFLAQKIPLFDACQLAVWIHGYAGDITKESKGEYGMIASDILENLPYAIKQFILNPRAQGEIL